MTYVNTKEDFRGTIRTLHRKIILYYTYTQHKENTTKVVIKIAHACMTKEKVKEALKENNQRGETDIYSQTDKRVKQKILTTTDRYYQTREETK